MATNMQVNHINQTVTVKEKQPMNTQQLIRWTGIPLMVAGIIFAGIQPIHPADVVASVTTSTWAIITSLKWVMCLFILLGMVGLYAREAKRAGWLGLIGFLLFSLSWAIQSAYVFAEAFMLPLLATAEPKFVDGLLGLASGHGSEVYIGALPAFYNLVGILYLLGGLLFGIATFRAGILSRWAGGLMAVTALLTPLAALLPHQIQRLAAIPMGLALAWLGYALWSGLREQASELVSTQGSPSLVQTAAD